MSAADLRAEYDKIVARYGGTLLRAARRMCGMNEDQAQDLVQEALIRGYEAFLDRRFQAGTNARAWLLRIMTNLFINSYRRDRRWNAGVTVDQLTAQGDGAPEALRADSRLGPETALMERTLAEPLEAALASLSEDLRLCVILVDIEGMEYAETAKLLNIPIGTVRSRLSRARLMLHKQLYDYARERRRV